MALLIVPDNKLLQIMKGCLQGIVSYQKELYTCYFGFGYNTCKRYLWNEDESLESTHDGFLKIYNRLETFQCPEAHIERSLKPWMQRIFARTAIDYLRRQKGKNLVSLGEGEETELVYTGEISTETSLSYKELLELIARLSPAYRLVFNLYVIDGFSHGEIAGMMGITEGASRANLVKARLNLQKWIQEESGQKKLYGKTAI